MHNRTTMRCHLTPVRTANHQKSINNKCWGRHKAKGTFLHCWWECKLVQPLRRIVWRFLKKLKIELTIWSSNLTPGHISGENHNLKKYMHPNVQRSTIYNNQDMETTYMSMDRGIDEEEKLYIHNGILLSHNKEWNNAIFSNMDGPRDYHTKWSKSDKYHIILLICGMWKKNDTNELIYKTAMDSQMSKTNLQLPKRKSWGEAWIGGLAYAHYCMWTIWSMWTCCVACV